MKIVYVFIVTIFTSLIYINCGKDLAVNNGSIYDELLPFDTIFMATDTLPDTSKILFRLAFYVDSSYGCAVYNNGVYVHYTKRFGTTRFRIVNKSIMTIKYVLYGNLNDTIVKSCIARDSVVWSITNDN